MADNNVSAINGGMWNPMFNSYYNQAGLSTLYDMDSMSMNGSLFGGGMMMPTFCGGMNYDSYFKNYSDMLNFQSNSQLQMVNNQRQNQIAINSPDAAIRKAAAILNEKIVSNEQEQIQPALKNFVATLRTKYPNATDEQLVNQASIEWGNYYQTPIPDLIREKGNNSFLQGLYQSLTFGFADNITAEENIAKIYGQPVSRTQQLEKSLGRAAGGAIVGTGTVLAASPFLKCMKGLKGKWAVIAGIVGGGIGLVSSLFGGGRTEQA